MSLPDAPPVTFRVSRDPATVAEELRRAFGRSHSEDDDALGTLPLRGEINDGAIRVWREPGFRHPWVEFRGTLVDDGHGTSVQGAYVDRRAFRRLNTVGVLCGFALLCVAEAILDWQLPASLGLLALASGAACAAFLANRIHLANRNADRDLLREEMEQLLDRIS